MPRWLRPTGIVIGALIVLAALAVGWLLLTAPEPQERDEWALGPELPRAFGELATVSVVREDGSEMLVVLSGLSGLGEVVDDVFTYEEASGAWSRGPSLPVAVHHASAAALDGAVWVSGGSETLDAGAWQGRREVWRWEPDEGSTWESMPPLPEARWGHRMVEFDGRLYVVGGHGETANTFVYHPDRDEWATAAPIPEMRDHLSVVATADSIWAIGGRTSENVARVDIYDPERDVWEQGPSLPEPTSGAAEGFTDGRVYVLGGEDPRLRGGVIDEHWVLDTRDERPRWELAQSPPLTVHGADGAVFEGRIVVVGGASRQGALSVTAWERTFQIMESPGAE
ncbi:MAG: hypothetical protein IBX62_08745 [Coriobacteriia bacterium]|nr:hypothetical protein [Coriobacteriia bacterium]